MERIAVVHWIWEFDSELSAPDVYAGKLTVSDDYGSLSLCLKNARKYVGESLNNRDLFSDDLWEEVAEVSWKGLFLREEENGDLTFRCPRSTQFLMARIMGMRGR